MLPGELRLAAIQVRDLVPGEKVVPERQKGGPSGGATAPDGPPSALPMGDESKVCPPAPSRD